MAPFEGAIGRPIVSDNALASIDLRPLISNFAVIPDYSKMEYVRHASSVRQRSVLIVWVQMACPRADPRGS